MAKAKETEKVKPMRLTDAETGTVYELDFDRESVRFAESRKFNVDEVLTYPQTNIPLLFFYAFRKNHRNVALNQAQKMFDELGGLTEQEILRLVTLYHQTNNSLVAQDEERKNSRMTLEL